MQRREQDTDKLNTAIKPTVGLHLECCLSSGPLPTEPMAEQLIPHCLERGRRSQVTTMPDKIHRRHSLQEELYILQPKN